MTVHFRVTEDTRRLLNDADRALEEITDNKTNTLRSFGVSPLVWRNIVRGNTKSIKDKDLPGVRKILKKLCFVDPLEMKNKVKIIKKQKSSIASAF